MIEQLILIRKGKTCKVTEIFEKFFTRQMNGTKLLVVSKDEKCVLTKAYSDKILMLKSAFSIFQISHILLTLEEDDFEPSILEWCIGFLEDRMRSENIYTIQFQFNSIYWSKET